MTRPEPDVLLAPEAEAYGRGFRAGATWQAQQDRGVRLDRQLMASVVQDHATSGIHGPLHCSLACGAVIADEYERRAALALDPTASEPVSA